MTKLKKEKEKLIIDMQTKLQDTQRKTVSNENFMKKENKKDNEK